MKWRVRQWARTPFPLTAWWRIGPRRQGFACAASRPGRLRADLRDLADTREKAGTDHQ